MSAKRFAGDFPPQRNANLSGRFPTNGAASTLIHLKYRPVGTAADQSAGRLREKRRLAKGIAQTAPCPTAAAARQADEPSRRISITEGT